MTKAPAAVRSGPSERVVRYGVLQVVVDQVRQPSSKAVFLFRGHGLETDPMRARQEQGLTASRGTGVRLALSNQLSPLLDAGYLEETIRRHFEPLLDPVFDDLLRRQYRDGIAFEVDGRRLTRADHAGAERAPIAIRLGRRRTSRALQRLQIPIEAYRKAVQEAVSRQLAEWGDTRDAETRPRTARLERDLERVLEDLADDFPLLRSLVDRRRGGQKRLPMPGRGREHVPPSLFANVPAGHEPGGGGAASPPVEGPESTPPEGASPPAPPPPTRSREEPPPFGDQPAPGTEPPPDEHSRGLEIASGTLDTVAGRRRPARYGLLVQTESRPGDLELARLVESTIWINDAHPAYVRALASRSLGYHTALAVALALAPLAVEARDEHAFITQFLAHWGGAQEGHRSIARRRSKKVDSGLSHHH